MVPHGVVPRCELECECHCPMWIWVMLEWKMEVRVGRQVQAGGRTA